MASVDLIRTAERIVKMALVEGAEQAEAYVESRQNLVMRLLKISGKDNFIARDQLMMGAALRVMKGGALGFAYLSDLEDDPIKASVRSALKVAEPQPGLMSLPRKPSGYPHVSGILDKNTADMGPDDVMSRLDAIKSSASQVEADRITVYDALFGRSRHGFAVANSHGLSVEDYGSFVRMAIGVMAKGNGKEARMEVSSIERTAKDIGIARDFGSKYGRRVLKYLGGKKIEPKKITVILNPAAVAELFGYAFANAFCADNVQHGASVLEGRIGEQIASELLTLVDDGTYEGGLVSFKMDDEGMPTRKTTLVEKGILKGYLHNDQTANVASTESTGNCSRWEMPTVDYFFYRSFKRLPRIFPSNLVFKPGNTSLETMIREVKDGVYVERTDPAFTASPDGSFSLLVLYGIRIENGELTTPVSTARIAGNIFDYAKKIDALGEKPEKFVAQLYPACFITPHIRIQDVSIQE